mgnify:CR=1 FL=1
MRKFVCLLAALALALTLCACNNAPDTPPAPDGNGTQTQDPSGPDNSGQTTPDTPPAGQGDTTGPGVTTPPPGPEDTSKDNDPPAKDNEPPTQDEQPGGQGSQDSQDEKDPAAMKETALGLIDQPVSELYAAIGQPLSADYAPSCLEVGGEDGELTYDGFTVYTVKSADGSETVYDVL